MPITHVFCGLPTADLPAALSWYERLFGRPPDNRPHEGEAVWGLTDEALVYVVSDPDRAGRGLLTLIVDDLDEQIADLSGRGVDPGPVETMAGRARRFTVTDPDGNSIQIAELARRG
jgi:catechol 2,3-dioxygenase-like lactoylglutathione lyase family enzyme